mgnify:CR=1 FL=1
MKMYFTQTAPTPRALDTAVQKLLNDGWTLRGEQHYSQGTYRQVLVKGKK